MRKILDTGEIEPRQESNANPRWLVVRSQQWPISFHLDRRVPPILIALSTVTLVAMAWSLTQGEYPIPVLDAIATVLHLETGQPEYAFIINTLRLPRILAAWGVGMALAIAGTLTQGITRNPLAAPGIIGVNAGASLAAVTALVIFPNAPAAILPLAAFSGALAIAVLIYLLAWKGGSSPVRLILVGIGFSLIAGALTNLMVTFGDLYNVSQALVWLAGSVYECNWQQVLAFVPWLVVFGLGSLLMTRHLNAVQLGDDIARSLGSRLEWQRSLLLLNSVALAGAAVATAGNIGFVGLMAPHLARQLVGPCHGSLLPVAAMTGGLLVVVADLVGRLLFSPIELPCGLIAAIVGAPYFAYLSIRNRRR